MENWLRERLSSCLGFNVPDDMILYVMKLKNSEELDNYFKTLLDKDCEEHLLFVADCKQRLFTKAGSNKKGQSAQQTRRNTPTNNKQQKNVVNQTASNQQQQQRKNINTGNAPIKQIASNDSKQQKTVETAVASMQMQPTQQQGTKKKNKYVNLYSSDGSVQGDVIMLKGRRRCDCQASQHKLINNCLNCGRIVCSQEGSGPCLFCGEIVCNAEELKVLKSSGQKSENLLKTLKEKGGGGEGLKKALEQRDRLLEYDRNSEKRTTVIDDELDYFQENSVWLNEEERAKYESLKQEMHEKKHESRAKRQIKVDFAGREIEQLPINDEYEKQLQQQLANVSLQAAASHNWSNKQYAEVITPDTCGLDPNLNTARPIYTTVSGSQRQPLPKNNNLERVYNRVQDKELLEMQDMRQALSMHQPYASLLVAGIKKHEGRTWYTEHRGRLWIASTAREPSSQEIADVENFYRNYYGDNNLKFPTQYPSSCLLGCVKIDECMAQEEYVTLYPNGESDSPYVFVCSNAEQLPVVFPIKGQHKIYQIDAKIHNAACRTLLRLQQKSG